MFQEFVATKEKELSLLFQNADPDLQVQSEIKNESADKDTVLHSERGDEEFNFD
jgi:hypothetical protein